MCVYVYNPNHKLLLEHVSETLVAKRGRYEILVDMLLKNESEENLTKFHVIVPHALFKVKYNKKKKEGELVKDKNFKDKTHDFKNGRSERNRIYKQPPNTLVINNENNIDYLTIKQIDPKVSSEIQELKGILTRTKNLVPREDLNMIEHQILTNSGIAIFTCELSLPLKSLDSGWFRWEIFTKTTKVPTQNLLKGIYNYMRNSSIYYYKIMGPYCVKNIVSKNLKAFETALKESNKDKDRELAYRFFPESYSKIFDNHIMRSTTTIKDWYVNLYTKESMEVSNISETGNINFDGKRTDNCNASVKIYSWKNKDIDRNVNAETISDDFSISFDIKFNNIWYQFLPYIGIISIIFSIISFIKGCRTR